MRLELPEVLTGDELQGLRGALGDDASWVCGRDSAGPQASLAKHNEQLSSHSPLLPPLQATVLAALQREPVLFSAALPRRWSPPLFNRYRPERPAYGPHVDNALLSAGQSQAWIRSDLSCTVFLSDPHEYEGGELVIHGPAGAEPQRVKLAAGSAVVYPSGSLHEVTPVTQGQRLAAVLWIESLVRQPDQRQLLFDLDMNLLKLRQRHGESAESLALTATYHQLLRQWANT